MNQIMQRYRPHFLGIGVTKAGTTWLWFQLKKHPELWMTPIKEVHFFDRSTYYPTVGNLATASLANRLLGSEPWDRQELMRGTARILFNILRGRFHDATWWSHWTFGYYNEEWYVKLFAQAKPHQICGEITPAYAILDPEDIAKIQAINPDMRIILMIRDPIERSWSGLRYSTANGKDMTFGSESQILSRLKKPDVVLRGNYTSIVDNYLKFFPASQMLICFYDAIARDPKGLMSSVADFLGIQDLAPSQADLEKKINVSPMRSMPDNVRHFLIEQYAPAINLAADRFGSYAHLWKARYSEQPACIDASKDDYLPPTVHP